MKFAQLGQILRTVRHLRPHQFAAAVLHVVRGGRRPRVKPVATPSLRAKVVSVPFLPAPAHARFDGARNFELIHRSHGFRDKIDWNYEGLGPLWAFHLHQFDYLRAPSLSSAARRRLIDDWIEHCVDGPGWDPHPISLRIVSWGKLLLTPGALEQSDEHATRMRASMAHQLETLSRGLEIRLQGNHLFSNLLGVVFAGLLFEGSRADAWLALESDLRREIAIQIQPDGSHIEGSPMYHALLLENVLDLLNLARAQGVRAPEALIVSLAAAAQRMLGAHRVWTHPDGEIALLGDAAFDIAQPPAKLEAYASSLGIKVKLSPRSGALADAGVYRMESADLVLIATAAPPAPAYQPGHAHCDALSFELSVGTQRVITDTGVSEYIPGKLREISRQTSSHATLQIDDCEQSEIWAPHRIGGRCEVEIEIATESCLDAHCTSWSRPRTRHRRLFQLAGGRLTIEDWIEGEQMPVKFHLPLAPDLEPELLVTHANGAAGESGRAKLSLELRDDKKLWIELPTGVHWAIERSAYFPRFGEHVERACLVGKADGFRTGTWRFSVSRRRGRRGRRR